MVQVLAAVAEPVFAGVAGASDVLGIGMLDILSALSVEISMFGLATVVYLACVYSRPLTFGCAPQESKARRCFAQEKRRQWASGKHPQTTPKDSSSTMCGDLGPKCITAIRACAKGKDLAGTIAVFEEHLQCGGVATGLLYKVVMDACVECGDMDKADAYFAQAKAEGLADVIGYNILMKGRLAAGEHEGAERLLAELPKEGLKATHASYHGLLNARVVAGDMCGAWRMIEEMQVVGIVPNVFTCSILLKGVKKPFHSADLLRVVGFVDSMEKQVDRPLFMSLLEACLRTGQGELALETLQKAGRSGFDFALMAPTYGSMIKFFGESKDVGHIWAVWREMENQGVKPTAITLGCMVEALVANGCAQDAWKLVRESWDNEDQRSLVNTITYSTLLKGFSSQPKTVLSLYTEMRECGIECNAVTYNTILNVFAQNGDMHLVPALLQDMAASSPPVDPDVVTYATLIKGYCASGNVDRAFRLFEDMRGSSNVAPDDVMYHCLLDGFAKAQRVGDALRLYDVMVSSGLAPSNYTLSILVKLLGRSKRLQQAFSLVEAVTRDHGVRPNIQVYTCLMQACFQNKQTAKAVSLLDRIIEDRLKPDERTYSALVHGCLAAGCADKALELAHRAYQGTRPVGIDAKVLSALTAKLGKGSEAVQSLLAAIQRPRQSASGTAGGQGGSYAPPQVGGSGAKAPRNDGIAPWRKQGGSCSVGNTRQSGIGGSSGSNTLR